VSAAPAFDERVARAWAALEDVPDPEVPVLSVVDLGVVRAIEPAGDRLAITVTPTYTGCPATAAINLAIAAAIEAAGLGRPTLLTALSPPWTTEWMRPHARAKLAAAGIAPPAAARDAAPFAPDPAVPCPRCGARATEKLSEFGATACKALWRCLACREPFEHFKCH
jgi:ring-1,2-phenylacetyl-CoA epoxidase subunit PaaD